MGPSLNTVRINYGIPNNTTIVAATDDLVRSAAVAHRENEEDQQIFQLREGKLRALVPRKRSDQA